MPRSSTGPVAVGLEPELGDEQRLRRVAGAEAVEERAERVAVVGRAAAGVEPAEVVVEADHVERRVRRLAGDPGPVADRHPDRAGGIELVGERGGAGDVVAPRSRSPASAARCRCSTAASTGGSGCRGCSARAATCACACQRRLSSRYWSADLVDGDLGPDQDPVAVGHLLDLGVERVVRADHGRAELAGPSRSAPPAAPGSARRPVWRFCSWMFDAAQVAAAGRSGQAARRR